MLHREMTTNRLLLFLWKKFCKVFHLQIHEHAIHWHTFILEKDGHYVENKRQAECNVLIKNRYGFFPYNKAVRWWYESVMAVYLSVVCLCECECAVCLLLVILWMFYDVSNHIYVYNLMVFIAIYVYYRFGMKCVRILRYHGRVRWLLVFHW